ncbi:FAD-dependent monooxygenase [Paenibacillus montanisoli]|uniref:2-polyprenyl-6-methoxyphenol hydroxylase n=1 Tax=Paenibacillus montanisoli TaxID=2081970 RepID=A0A328TS75_9BACL|nr:FAD-dependent monooxygenase [Paenibacillus montanisoli]RAP73447.1 2-polyprenyl-6-methoxyphenol hydroxylase [Paenibacillus montanisoli]
MSEANKRRAIVIGAGIGGLSAALALRQRGWQVAVYDRAAALREAGAGIVLAANAMKALDLLGVGGQARTVGAPVEQADIRSWDGRLITSLPAAEQAAKYGTHSYVMHRADLQSILLHAVAAESPVHTGMRWLTGERKGDLVTAVFEDDTREDANVLIGADGLHSTVRERLFGESPLRYSGYAAYRGVCTLNEARIGSTAGGGFEALGTGLRFGYSRLGRGRVFWFAAINAPQGSLLPVPARKQALLSRFSGWYRPVLDALEATEASEILAHDIADRAPLSRWSTGNMTLLGDAAHPMLPNLGQGGAQAVEDAIVLARCLEQGDVPSALEAYEKERMARTSRIVRMSRSMGRMVQLESKPLIWLRNRLLAAVPPSAYIKRFDPIVGYAVR